MAVIEYKGLHPVLGGGRVYGGPYREIAKSWRDYQGDSVFTVKMAAEINEPCHADVPTKDFCTPDDVYMVPAIKEAINAIIDGKNVYAGCMGGIGRTGLFLGVLTAILVKDEDPVKLVRAGFKGHAIETPEQMDYVRKFTRRHTWFTRRQRVKVAFYNAVRKVGLLQAVHYPN